MPTQIAIGFSEAVDIQEAAQQACIAVKNQLNTARADLVVVFACGPYARAEILETIHTILKPDRLIGSSTAGVILSTGVFPRGIAVLAVNSDEITFGIAANRPMAGTNLRTAGFDWARKINADFKTTQHQACLIFTDHALQNDTQFIRGAQEVLGFGFPILGALSSDDIKHKRYSQFYQKQFLTQSAVGLLISGGTAAIGSKHGFKPLGKPRAITHALNNIIHAIDGQPAMNIYKEFLGAETEGLGKGGFAPYNILYPLGIYLEEQKQYLLKNAVDILSDGSIVCQGEVPQGAEVHLMIGNRDTCKQSAIDAANQVKDGLGGRQAKLIVIIESMARHKILKHNAFLEIQAVKEILGYTTPIIGLYSFGEITPMTPEYGISSMHIQNESIMILAVN
ncbi:MAG: FIST C-terminal domain-containing protein [Candidatus Omnitrophica bacterium]|nr:FIST C-terminal domain-containing protein [Candidatus Omnitrophota bacterium]